MMTPSPPTNPTFDPTKEVLHCDKPGTGLADAPRAFQVKLVGILTKKCGTRQSSVDNELCFRHDASGVLILIMTIHVDDFVYTGPAEFHEEVKSTILKDFNLKDNLC